MGLFDIFKRKGKEKEKSTQNALPKEFDIKYSRTKEGRLQIDFHKDVDVTRLILDNKNILINGEEVNIGYVSWYRDDDVIFLDPSFEGESINARDYKRIATQLDESLLISDEKYCKMVMESLLDKDRVDKYLEQGLQEETETPCGEYIGGVRKTENGYKKFFSIPIGEQYHNSFYMQNKRQAERERKREKENRSKQDEILRMESHIKAMQQRINEIKGDMNTDRD